MTLLDITPPEERASLAELYEDIKNGTQAGWRAERRYIRKNGEDLWVFCNGYIQRNSDGIPLNILNTFFDITTLKETQHALQNALKVRDNFLSIASHELKTPLTSLQLQIQLRQRDLKRNPLDSSLVNKLQKSLSEQFEYVTRIGTLIDDILDVSKINEGKLSYHFENFDLCDMVTTVIDRFKVNADAHGVKILFEGCHSVLGKWDRFRLEQVLLNLLTNAVRYGNKKPIHVRVGSKQQFAFMAVKDEGIGIKSDDQLRIFNRFERAISENEVSGLGLGLYISNEIVKAHHGRIQVRSQEGLGSEFIVEVPQTTDAEKPSLAR